MRRSFFNSISVRAGQQAQVRIGLVVAIVFLALLGGIAAALASFVLILFAIEFEIEHAGEIAASVLPASTTATAAKSHLNVAEGSFGAQQMLQRLLLGN